jgi:hypothetical protein
MTPQYVIKAHHYPANSVRKAYTSMSVHVGGFRWETVWLFRDRPVFVSSSVRVRNPRGGMMTQMVIRFIDDNSAVSVTATEWSRKAKPWPVDREIKCA